MILTQQIRQTIQKLEEVNNDFEYVKNRDFTHVIDHNGYTLGSTEHDYGDNLKIGYDIYKKVGDKSFDWKGKTYDQEIYHMVKKLDISPYVSQVEAIDEFKKTIDYNQQT